MATAHRFADGAEIARSLAQLQARLDQHTFHQHGMEMGRVADEDAGLLDGSGAAWAAVDVGQEVGRLMARMEALMQGIERVHQREHGEGMGL